MHDRIRDSVGDKIAKDQSGMHKDRIIAGRFVRSTFYTTINCRKTLSADP